MHFIPIYLYCLYLLTYAHWFTQLTLLCQLDTLVNGIHFCLDCFSPWLPYDHWATSLLTYRHHWIKRYIIYAGWALAVDFCKYLVWNELRWASLLTAVLSFPCILNIVLDLFSLQFEQLRTLTHRALGFVSSAIVVSLLNRFGKIVLEVPPMISLESFSQCVHQQDVMWGVKFLRTMGLALMFLCVESENSRSLYIALTLRLVTFWNPKLKMSRDGKSIEEDRQLLIQILLSGEYFRLQEFEIIVKALRLIIHHRRGVLRDRIQSTIQHQLTYLSYLFMRPMVLSLFAKIVGLPRLFVIMGSFAFLFLRFMFRPQHPARGVAQFLFLEEYAKKSQAQMKRHFAICFALKVVLALLCRESSWLPYLLELSEILSHTLVQRLILALYQRMFDIRRMWLYSACDLPVLICILWIFFLSHYLPSTVLILLLYFVEREALSYVIFFLAVGALSSYHLYHVLLLAFLCVGGARVHVLITDESKIIEHMIIQEYAHYVLYKGEILDAATSSAEIQGESVYCDTKFNEKLKSKVEIGLPTESEAPILTWNEPAEWDAEIRSLSNQMLVLHQQDDLPSAETPGEMSEISEGDFVILD